MDDFYGSSAVERQVFDLHHEYTAGSATTRKLRSFVLTGGFLAQEQLFAAGWKTPSWRLVVFISSTFSDTRFERDYLILELLYELRAQGRKFGIDVCFVDMRWGIRSESTADHRAWDECANSISWCKAESGGIYFLSLQASKYGYIGLPRTLRKATLQDILGVIASAEESELDLLFKWYREDENALEVEYKLRELDGVDDKAYSDALPELLNLLRGFSLNDCSGMEIGQSMTEWEVREAISTSATVRQEVDIDEGHSKLIWFRKLVQIEEDGSNDVYTRNYDDTVHDDDRRSRLSSLINHMEQHFAPSAMEIYPEPLSVSDMLNPYENSCLDVYMKHFTTFVSSKLWNSLQSIIDNKQQWMENGFGLGIPGDLLAEMLHHADWARTKCESFVGREKLLSEIMTFVELEHRDASFPDKFSGISLAVIGASGMGKTALMAKSASLFFQAEQKRGQDVIKRPVLIRFCGTSASSRAARSLIFSLCAQIEHVHHVALEDRKSDFLFNNAKFDELVAYFHSLLATYPLILFIDALDQLSDEDLGRSQISFLKGVRPHYSTRIIVSCLPDEREMNFKTGRRHLYLCETRLLEAAVPILKAQMSSIDHLQAVVEEATLILTELLRKKRRKLSNTQLSFVQSRIAIEQHHEEVTALYLNLLVKITSQWTSNVNPVESLPTSGGVQPLIMEIFTSLERNFGSKLVQTALGFITFSTKGISDQEMEDLLSIHDETLLDDVFQFHKPALRRLPTHVWLRLRNALDDLIVQRENFCLQFYHRQLQETAEWWLQSDRINLCKTMAIYFGNLVDETLRVSRKITLQEWTVNGLPNFHEGSVVNLRRCNEAARHMLTCRMYNEAVNELCNFAGIVSKLRCSSEGFQLILDLQMLQNQLENLEITTTNTDRNVYQEEISCSNSAIIVMKTRVEHYLRWLRQDLYKLSASPIKLLLSLVELQPRESLARQDANILMQELNVHNISKESDNHDVHLQFARPIGENQRISFEPFVAEMKGHSGYVSAVSFSTDDNFIASGSSDNTVRIWDAKSAACVAVLEGHSYFVHSVSFSPDGTLLASGSADRTIRLWDLIVGSCIKELRDHTDGIGHVCFSSDGKLLFSGSWDCTIRVWNLDSYRCNIVLKGHSDRVTCLCVSSDNGNQIVSGSWDNTIRIWDKSSGNCTNILKEHTNQVTSISLSPNGNCIASGSRDKSVRVWDIQSGCCLVKLNDHMEDVNSVSFSPDGNFIASGSMDKTIRLWDIMSGDCVAVFIGHTLHVSSVCFSSDGKLLTSGSFDESIRIWDINKPLTSSEETAAATPDAHKLDVLGVCFSPDGKHIASCSRDKTVKVWDAVLGNCEVTLHGHERDVLSVCFNFNGNLIASSSYDQTVRVWDWMTYSCLAVFDGHGFGAYSVCFSPNGELLVSGSWDQSVRIWDLTTNSFLTELDGQVGKVLSVCFSPEDGDFVASGSTDKNVRLWHLPSSRLFVFNGHTADVRCVCFSPDGILIASGSYDKSIRVWDLLNAGICRVELIGHSEGISSVSFSSDGKMLASSSWDTTIRLWNTNSYECIASLKGHVGGVTSLAFSPDGKFIVSGSVDKVIRVWDVN